MRLALPIPSTLRAFPALRYHLSRSGLYRRGVEADAGRTASGSGTVGLGIRNLQRFLCPVRDPDRDPGRPAGRPPHPDTNRAVVVGVYGADWVGHSLLDAAA